MVHTGCLTLKRAFYIGSDRQEYASQVLFEGSFGILRLYIFRQYNQFLWNAYCAPSIGPDVNHPQIYTFVLIFSPKFDQQTHLKILKPLSSFHISIILNYNCHDPMCEFFLVKAINPICIFVLNVAVYSVTWLEC